MTVAGPNGAGARTCRSNSNAMASGAPHSPALTEAVITFLEMREPPALPELRAPLGKLALMRVEHPSLAFYKFLYDEVGQGYHWTERKVLSDRDLVISKVIIEDDQVEINVLYVGGVPAGFSELDRRQPPEIELCYFGICRNSSATAGRLFSQLDHPPRLGVPSLAPVGPHQYTRSSARPAALSAPGLRPLCAAHRLPGPRPQPTARPGLGCPPGAAFSAPISGLGTAGCARCGGSRRMFRAPRPR